MVARLLWEQDAAGSNPVTSTKKTSKSFDFGVFFIDAQILKMSILRAKQALALGF